MEYGVRMQPTQWNPDNRLGCIAKAQDKGAASAARHNRRAGGRSSLHLKGNVK